MVGTTTTAAAAASHPLADAPDDDHLDDHHAGADHGHDPDDDDALGGTGSGLPPRKRQRVRLSCLECRRRKLSCSRELPCDRCIKSGTPDKCSYEPRPGASTSERTSGLLSADHHGYPPRDTSHPLRDIEPSVFRDAARDHDRIRRLELEVAQLRKQVSLDGSVASPSTLKDVPKDSPACPPDPLPSNVAEKPGDGLEYKFIKGNNFKTRYFGSHNAWSSFKQLHGLQPFMKETADEWLRPLNIQKKDREKRKRDREKRFAEPDESLEALLPPRAETDLLVNLYLDQFEQIHRIVHLPSFKREYRRFWDPPRTRNAAFTALVLAMLAISNCIDGQETKFVGVKSSAFQTAEKWVKACDEWLNRQSHKHRRLIHYQTMCLLYLAKRVNVIKKKRFWTSSNSLVGEGIIVGLHRDPEQMSTAITPYYSEMRRRLWATIIEFDIQSSYDQGLPTMLSQLPIETRAPRNINDEDFDEDSEELPPSKDFDRYTTASYQHASRQSLQLRLELNQVLTGPIATLDWEQVTRYRDMILQEIDALPHWGPDDLNDAGVLRKPILGYTLLRLQLKQYLVPLHQSFLKLAQSNSKYQLAEFVYYNAARDVVLMHDSLFKKGIRALYFLREDTMNAAVNLCHVSLLQPKVSTSLISSNARETLLLMQRCLEMKTDRILRCGNNDPWGYSSMLAAIGLLEVHLDLMTPVKAKAQAAERFIKLHHRLLAYQELPLGNGSQAEGNEVQGGSDANGRPQVGGARSNQSSVQSGADVSQPSTPFPLDAATTMLQPPPGPTPFMPWSDAGQPNGFSFDYNFVDQFGMGLDQLWGTGDWNHDAGFD